MGDFKRSRKPRFDRRDSGGSRGRFDREDFGRSGRRDSFGSGRSQNLDMHEATCAKCGRTCEVPFRPTGAKPVYCSDCFRKGDNFQPRDGPSLSSSSSRDLEEINMKLDKILRALNID